jgi:hypothetical protein
MLPPSADRAAHVVAAASGGHLRITHQRACYAVEFQMTATVEMQLGRTQAEATQRLLADAAAKRPWWKRLAGLKKL